MEQSLSGVGVLDKAAALLEALEGGPRSLAALMEATGLPRATAHRLLVAMEGLGWVGRGDGGFSLGGGLARLGAAALAGPSLADVARPALEELRDRTGESVQLYLPRGDQRVCVLALESPHSLRTIVPVGAVLPMDRGSAGAVLRDEDGARRRGWAQSVEERELGVASVSAPVRSESGRVAAAVSVSGPLERTSRSPGRRYAGAVVEAARRVEEGLWGGAPSPPAG
ncbi:MAG TPA: IclR family transcriptional regulator C-terminal domain-containing protein [Acidimicrobiales bacterium]|nr:IclR family transcriptional regulator C-terminal domain-containing protein [Acidimicrobiales bacterium]